ncbi:MAG: hypothetical protein Q9174_005971 [Haloplaca sp. 1 TL-2023]
MALDPVPEVRAAALHALTNFIGIPDLTAQVKGYEESVALVLINMASDANSMVRRELLIFFSVFVKRYQHKFLVCAFEQLMAEKKDMLARLEAQLDSNPQHVTLSRRPSTQDSESEEPHKVSKGSIQGSIWMRLLLMTIDPHPEVAQDAKVVVDYMHEKLLASALGPRAQPLMDEVARLGRRLAVAKPPPNSRQPSSAPNGRRTPMPGSPAPPALPKNESYLSMGMRRTASMAAALKNMTFGGANENDTPTTTPQPRAPGQLKRARVPEDWSRPPDSGDPAFKPSAYVKAKPPKPKGWKKGDAMTPPSIPLKSTFFEWSIEYFGEPQMRPNEPDEPGSDDYNRKLWRRIRNEKVLSCTQPMKGIAGTSKWDTPNGYFNNGTQPTKMCFHQFEDHLAIADDRDSVCIWDWKKSTRLNRFSNGNPLGSRINEARFINEDDQALLLTGSSDGIVKIYRNYEAEQGIELVSAWKALSNMEPSTKSAGLVLDWQQGQGKLLVAGDVKVIRVWNAATEICTNVSLTPVSSDGLRLTSPKDIPARSSSPLTSLTTDAVAGNIIIAGYGDGAVRVFDQRMKPALAMVKVWRKHAQWVTNVHMQRGGLRELVSGCRDGEVKLWDLRYKDEVRTMRAVEPGAVMRGLSVHEHAPVFAAGSSNHTLNVYSMSGSPLSTLEPTSPSSYAGSHLLHGYRNKPIASAAFHPHRMLIAAGAVESSWINVWGCKQAMDDENHIPG